MMNRNHPKKALPFLLRLVPLAALILCPSLPARPRPAEKPNAVEEEIEKPKEVKEPKTAFILHGGFVQGILLRRQEELQQLALLVPRVPGTIPEDYQASIDWGDNSGVTRGRLADAGHGIYNVTGRHVYAATGHYAVKVGVTGPDGTTAEVRGGIEVGDLYAGSLDNWTAASIPAGDVDASVGDLQATIDWGDGSPAADGFVRREGEVFLVGGSHTYAQDGPYTISVLATEGSAVKMARKREVRVVRPQIAAKVFSVRANPGEACTNVEVANFHVPNPLAAAREFSALINWGDGTPLDTAVIIGSSGEFRVLSSHTYAEPGAYQIRTILIQSWH